jgi:hypothetical protein
MKIKDLPGAWANFNPRAIFLNNFSWLSFDDATYKILKLLALTFRSGF